MLGFNPSNKLGELQEQWIKINIREQKYYNYILILNYNHDNLKEQIHIIVW